MIKLSEFIQTQGFEVVIYPRPERHPDKIGFEEEEFGNPVAQVCKDSDGHAFIALKADSWSCATQASHEIAEYWNNFEGHTEEMWCSQAIILDRMICMITDCGDLEEIFKNDELPLP